MWCGITHYYFRCDETPEECRLKEVMCRLWKMSMGKPKPKTNEPVPTNVGAVMYHRRRPVCVCSLLLATHKRVNIYTECSAWRQECLRTQQHGPYGTLRQALWLDSDGPQVSGIAGLVHALMCCARALPVVQCVCDWCTVRARACVSEAPQVVLQRCVTKKGPGCQEFVQDRHAHTPPCPPEGIANKVRYYHTDEKRGK